MARRVARFVTGSRRDSARRGIPGIARLQSAGEARQTELGKPAAGHVELQRLFVVAKHLNKHLVSNVACWSEKTDDLKSEAFLCMKDDNTSP
jgi:hypothetical protein